MGESKFASVFVVARVVRGELGTESVAVVHWERERGEGGRWMISGFEGLRGRASSFGFG